MNYSLTRMAHRPTGYLLHGIIAGPGPSTEPSPVNRWKGWAEMPPDSCGCPSRSIRAIVGWQTIGLSHRQQPPEMATALLEVGGKSQRGMMPFAFHQWSSPVSSDRVLVRSAQFQYQVRESVAACGCRGANGLPPRPVVLGMIGRPAVRCRFPTPSSSACLMTKRIESQNVRRWRPGGGAAGLCCQLIPAQALRPGGDAGDQPGSWWAR